MNPALERGELSLIEKQITRALLAGAVGLDQEASRLIGQITALEMQRDDARVALQVERASLASLERELVVINPQLAQRIASGVERRIQARQEQLAEEEDALAKILLENPDLRERETDALQTLDQRIQRLRAEIDSLSVQYVGEVAAAGGISGSADGLTYVADLRRQTAERRLSISRVEAKLEVLDSRLQSYQAAMMNLPQSRQDLMHLLGSKQFR